MNNSKLLGKNIRFLRKQMNLKQDEMQAGTGVPRATWSNYENDITEPDLSTLINISNFFGVSVDSLLTKDVEFDSKNVHLNKTGSEKKIDENVHPNVHPIVHPKGKKEQFSGDILPHSLAEPDAKYGAELRPIPITDISVAAGSGAFNSDHIENIEFIQLPARFLKRNATYLAVLVKGPSMAPTLQDGGYCVIRLIDRSEWAKIPDESVVCVSDREGKSYLKRIKNRLKQGFIVMRSDSPDRANFPSFNLQEDEINTIWYADLYFTAKMPNIHDQYYTRLQGLEDKVEQLERKVTKINPQLK